MLAAEGVGWKSVLHLMRVAVALPGLGRSVVGKRTATGPSHIGGVVHHHRNYAVGGGFALAVLSSVQCCGSGMFIPDPDFYSSPIPDQKTGTKERGEKYLLSCLFL
jgi:hypothetical protein